MTVQGLNQMQNITSSLKYTYTLIAISQASFTGDSYLTGATLPPPRAPPNRNGNRLLSNFSSMISYAKKEILFTYIKNNEKKL